MINYKNNKNTNQEKITKKNYDKIPHQKQSSEKIISYKTKELINKKNHVKLTNINFVDDVNGKSINYKGNNSNKNSPKKEEPKFTRRVGSISYLRGAKNTKSLEKRIASELPNCGSSYFHRIVNNFYHKEFPNKINTNDIMKLMLFLNEYLINNNLLNDCNKNENKKLLEKYSKYLINNIAIDFPEETDINDIDTTVKYIKIIKRNWREKKIKNYFLKDIIKEKVELKKMIINKYIKKSGYKTRKITGMFNTIIDNFDKINTQ